MSDKEYIQNDLKGKKDSPGPQSETVKQTEGMKVLPSETTAAVPALVEKSTVVATNRVAKVVKGGKRRVRRNSGRRSALCP